MVETVQEIYENQRYFGPLGWQAPGLLDRSNWTNTEGKPVQADPLPTEVSSNEWDLVFDHSTDAEGWVYGSVFKHLEYSRPGGRSSQRAGDFVRRRLWRRKAASQSSGAHCEVSGAERTAGAAVAAAGSAVSSLVSPVFSMQGVRVRKQTELEKRKAAVMKLVGMLTSMFRRRHFYEVLPMDPVAWPLLLAAHREALRTSMAELAVLHRVDASTMLPPAAKEHASTGEQDVPHMSLLQVLLCGAMHSRAAYGYAMAAGHLSSLLNFALLQTVHQFDFCAAGGASGEANNEAVAKLAGVRPGHLLMAEWNNSVGRPCHYVAADLANQCIVVAIRGSLEIGDMLSDVTAAPMEMTLLGVQGKVHEGMMSAATFVHCNTVEALEAAAKQFPGWPVLVTGHSYGGGVAAILAALLRDGGAPPGLGPISCIALGCAAVFSLELAEMVTPFTTSVVYGADVVPRLSAASVEGAFLELAAASPVRTAAAKLGRRVTSTLEGLKVDWKVAMKGPKLGRDSFPGQMGLSSLLTMAENSDAYSAAAQTALAAARLAGYRNSDDAETGVNGIEMAAMDSASPPSPATPSSAPGAVVSAADFAQHERDRGGNAASTSPAIADGVMAGATVSPADKAVHRLQLLRGAPESCRIQTDGTHEQRARHQPDGAGSVNGGSPGPKGHPIHMSTSESEDDDQHIVTSDEVAEARAQAAAAADKYGGSEHPEPLFMPGQVLWVIPPEEATEDALSSIDDEASPMSAMGPAFEVTMQSVEEQARLNSDAMRTAATAGQAADALGPGKRAPGNAEEASSGNASREGRSPAHSGAAGSSAAEVSSTAVEQLSRDSSQDRKTTREPEQDELLQPYSSPRKAARHQLNEQHASRAKAALIGGQGVRGGDADMHTPEQAAASLLDDKWMGAGAGDGLRRDKRRPVLAQVDRRQFGRILFSFDTMPDHLPDTYLTALQEL
ncbi:probable Sn1-specific diacylglycerol lipase alpha at N-terminal half [Coccomyxa sp. Obi]|nr:probable Sn1-specific diacylglycerol lipase alpha at N-terminal half [Coccomyxa sp. Obi]